MAVHFLEMHWVVHDDRQPRKALVEVARRAVEKFPERADAWQHLAAALLADNSAADAMNVLQTATQRFPSEPWLHMLASRAAVALRNRELALSESATALSLAPGDMAIVSERFLTLVQAGAWDLALPMLDQVLALLPNQSLAEYVCGGLLRAERFEDAIAAARECLHQSTAASYAVYAIGVSLARLGRDDEARLWIDPDRFTSRTRIAVPPGYTDAQSFHAALIEEIESNPTLAPDPPGTSTHDGLQTQFLRRSNGPAIEALLDAIRSSVESYVEHMPPADHPFARFRPQNVRLSSWAVVYPEKGQQHAHIHPSGWISGVYYVATPPPGADRANGGSVVLGGLAGKPLGEKIAWGSRIVTPQAGDLLMFPSWLPHGTIPTGATTHRICVAFDVVSTDQG